MTELLLLLAFLRQWSNVGTECYLGLIHDIRLLQRIVDFVDSASAYDYFANVITDLNRLDDAIVVGLARKSKPFSYTSEVFSRKPKSVLPKFFYGPLSRIFDDNGFVYARIDTKSVQFCLESLRLVRRAKHKAFTKKAADKAAEKFITYQTTNRPGNKLVLDEMATMWSLFENSSDFYESIKWGSPGNGVTQDMRFPYVPDLCFLANEVQSPYAVVNGAYQKAFNDLDPTARHTNRYFNHCLSECQFVGFYQKPAEGIASLSIVDKKFDEGRAITVSDTARTITGAIARNSIFNHHRINGSISMVNVFDQQSSHRVLEKHFHTISCVDLEGGSSCLTIENLDYMLSKTTFTGPLWKDSRPAKFKWKSQVYDLSTLTMGDATSVALLTTTLWLVMVLGYMRYHNIPLHSWGFRRAVHEMRTDGRFRTVGDDMIFPDYLYEIISYLLRMIGVTINDRKSSRATSLHKESCGAWFVYDGLEHLRRIYPFRAAVSIKKDRPSVTQTIEQYVDKNYESPFSKALFLAHTTILLPMMGRPEDVPYRVLYESLLSYHPSIVGTRFGHEWSHVYRVARGAKTAPVPDIIAYARGLKESLCTPRLSRRPDRLLHRERVRSASLGHKRSVDEHRAFVLASRMLCSDVKTMRLILLKSKLSPTPLPDWNQGYRRFSRVNGKYTLPQNVVYRASN